MTPRHLPSGCIKLLPCTNSNVSMFNSPTYEVVNNCTSCLPFPTVLVLIWSSDPLRRDLRFPFSIRVKDFGARCCGQPVSGEGGDAGLQVSQRLLPSTSPVASSPSFCWLLTCSCKQRVAVIKSRKPLVFGPARSSHPLG